jgi:hypothetical protein
MALGNFKVEMDIEDLDILNLLFQEENDPTLEDEIEKLLDTVCTF